ncbi:hypothetical protein Tco_1534832, partial [Tanacetum coccineum]
KLSAFTWSWVVFAVRVQGSILNPSPPFLLKTISPLKGCFGLCDFQVGMGYKGNGEVGMVRGLAPNKVQVGFVCTMAEIGCNWARIGPSKSSQSLSIAHKWAVVID